MSKQNKIFISISAYMLVVLLTNTGCATLTKTKFNHKKTESFCNISSLVGPDTYYYSESYQKKLKKSIKRISRK